MSEKSTAGEPHKCESCGNTRFYALTDDLGNLAAVECHNCGNIEEVPARAE